MKLGVETRHLRHAGKVRLRQADERQRGRCVQRRKGRGGLQLPQHRIVDAAMLAQRRPAMHDAVPDGVWRRHPGRRENTGDTGHRVRMVSRGIRRNRAEGLAEQPLGPCRIDAVQAALQGRRAAVQRQDVQRAHWCTLGPAAGPATRE
jgi:hypothetical protein